MLFRSCASRRKPPCCAVLRLQAQYAGGVAPYPVASPRGSLEYGRMPSFDASSMRSSFDHTGKRLLCAFTHSAGAGALPRCLGWLAWLRTLLLRHIGCALSLSLPIPLPYAGSSPNIVLLMFFPLALKA